MTHKCVSKLTIIDSDNGLSPGRRQAIIWTNAGILLIGHLGTNFSEILIEILTFPFKKMSLKVSSAKWRPFCLGLKVELSVIWENYLNVDCRYPILYAPGLAALCYIELISLMHSCNISPADSSDEVSVIDGELQWFLALSQISCWIQSRCGDWRHYVTSLLWFDVMRTFACLKSKNFQTTYVYETVVIITYSEAAYKR